MSILEKDNNGIIKNYSGSAEGYPLGTIITSLVPLFNENYHLLNGDNILIANYEDFNTLLTTLVGLTYSVTCTANEYAESIHKTGNCGKFVINSTSSDITGTYTDENSNTTTITVTANSIKLPTIKKFIEGVSSLADLGESFAAGLPNIRGELSFWNPSMIAAAPEISSVSGAFTAEGSNNIVYPSGSASSTSSRIVNLDASKANKIYGNSNTVQPEAVRCLYYIVLKNNSTIGLINYLNDLSTAGVQSLGGAVGNITLSSKLKISNNELDLDNIDLLWENEYPTTSMGDTTIILSSSDYSYLLVFYVYYASNNQTLYSTIIKKNEQSLILLPTDFAGNIGNSVRTLSFNSEVSITISRSTTYKSSGSVTDNNFAVPKYIYGIK